MHKEGPSRCDLCIAGDFCVYGFGIFAHEPL